MSADQPIELLSSSDEEDGHEQQQPPQRRPIAVPKREQAAASNDSSTAAEGAAVDAGNANETIAIPNAAAPSNRNDPPQASSTSSATFLKEGTKGKKRALLTSVAAGSSPTAPASSSHTNTTSSTTARQITAGMSDDTTTMKDSTLKPPPPGRHLQLDDDDDDDSSFDFSRFHDAAAAVATASDQDSVDFSPVHPAAATDHKARPEPLDFMKRHCWVCKVWIEHPTMLEENSEPNRNTFEFEYCCYLQHEHPTLSVPVCVVCSEQLESVVLSPSSSPVRKEDQLDTEKTTICCGCGREDSDNFNPLWFFCDDCPRVFCHHCLAQAYGKANVVEDLCQSKEKWKCCACAPPSLLRQLQEYTMRLQQQAEEALEGKVNSTDEKDEKKMNDLLDFLQMAEDKMFECDLLLEKEGMEKEFKRIRMDVQDDEDNAGLSDEEMECLIQQEQESWKQSFEDHHVRLADTISTIQDILKSVYGIDTLSLYQQVLSEQKSRLEKEEGAEPEYKRAADLENAKREREYLRKGFNHDDEDDSYDPNDERYRIEITSDVEDLGKLHSSEDDDGNEGSCESDASYAEFRAGWRHSRYKASQEAIDGALEEEEKRYSELQIVASVRNRQDDAKEMKNWVRTLKKTPKRNRVSKKSKQGRKSSSTAKQARKLSPSPSPKKPSVGKRRAVDADLDSESSDDEMQMSSPVRRSTRKKPSSLVLSSNPLISVVDEMAKNLKQHQREGVQFMYRNSFADLGGDGESGIGGCILAHSMGLGKSFSTIALLHTLMFLPESKIRKVLLVVPVNTVANWEKQFNQWQEPLKQKLTIYMLGDIHANSRPKTINSWHRKGGVLISSCGLFSKAISSNDTREALSSADAVVLDESHTMLKNTSNVLFKALEKVKTKRRVCLTGTPFQNNLLEYFRMLSYIRPGLFKCSERQFQKNYAEPIRAGMAADAMPSIQQYADELITDFTEKVAPFVHRRDAKVLLTELPPLQQAVLHVRPTSTQKSLFLLYGMHQRKMGQKNFFDKFCALRPIHNHPATILYKQPERESKAKKASRLGSKSNQKTPSRHTAGGVKVEMDPAAAASLEKETSGLSGRDSPDSIIDLLSDSDEEAAKEIEEAALLDAKHWSHAVLNKFSPEELKDPCHGNKCILVLHLLMQAQSEGDKVLLFSQSLATLDYLMEMLAHKDWTKLVSSLQAAFPNQKMGGWKEGVDFVRIDGSTSGGDRGDRIKEFEDHDGIKLFLISVAAGSLGINLCAANRVILMDSHFNPTVDLQAIYRAYRYGQTKPVYCYRFLTQGSMEEKVYSRAVTKSGLAGSVVDGKAFLRCFNQEEINSLAKTDDWVECDKCGRWRMFPPDTEMDQEKFQKSSWNCEMMNEYDFRMKWKCSQGEKDPDWYIEHYRKPNRPLNEKKASASQIIDSVFGRLSDEKTKEFVAKDKILQNLLTVSASGKEIVSKHYFHDALLADENASVKKEKNVDKKKAAGSRNNTPKKKAKLSASSRAEENSETSNPVLEQAQNNNESPRKRVRASEASDINHQSSSTVDSHKDKKLSKRVTPTLVTKNYGFETEFDL